MSVEQLATSLRPSLENVYSSYGNPSKNCKEIFVRIWNAIKHIIGQSRWQIAHRQLSAIILKDGNKDSGNFAMVAFPGLRKNLFSSSEASEIAENFLTIFVKKSQKKKNFDKALEGTFYRIGECTGEVLFRKAEKNPALFPDLDMKDRAFTSLSYREQLGTIFEKSVKDGSRVEGYQNLSEVLRKINEDRNGGYQQIT